MLCHIGHFPGKNANLLGVFLKQYTISLARLITVPLFETWLEFVLDLLGRLLIKANRSEFNSLHTGSNGMCLWPRNDQNMRGHVYL